MRHMLLCCELLERMLCGLYVLGECASCVLMPWVAPACAELLTHVGMVVA